VRKHFLVGAVVVRETARTIVREGGDVRGTLIKSKTETTLSVIQGLEKWLLIKLLL
jgi:hypothetical protein